MGISTDTSIRQQLIFLTILTMLVALFTARGVLSFGIIFFFAITCIHLDFFHQLRRFVSNPLLVVITFLFFVTLLSGLWSDDKEEWFRWVRIKLPLLLFPVAFAGSWQLSARQWNIIAFVFLVLVFTGCCWSLWKYMEDVQAVNKGYLSAKVMTTPLENDHVRFSLLVCIAIICSVLLLKRSLPKHIKMLLIFSGAFFIIYLHILSARTGLLNLYIFLGLLAIYLMWTFKRTKITIALCALLIAMPVAAWFLLPTFANRIRYVLYDFSFIQKNTYLPGSNDGSRMHSIKAGWAILKDNPFGVGSGDVLHETYAWYDDHIPGMLETDKLYPSSEWLLYGASTGWPGVLVFLAAMVTPFLVKTRTDRFFFVALNSVIAFSFFFDIALAQFGIFIYGFFVLWWWKWLNKDG